MKKIVLICFIATCLLQWFVPLNMIFQQEKIIREGMAFKFKTRPVDPNDPFRGKYVVLNYEADNFETYNSQKWKVGETVFVQIGTDQDGFAQIIKPSKTVPPSNQPFVEAKIHQIWGKNPAKVHIQYPFEQFYMEEHKAPKAEALFREMRRDSNTIAYSLVLVKNGKAALEDVRINEVSIKELTSSSK